jgi:hypothetical protein
MCRRLWDPADSLIVYYAVVDLLIANPLSSVRLGYLAFTRVQISPMEFFHFLAVFFPDLGVLCILPFLVPALKGRDVLRSNMGNGKKI